jgi:hypothetical protein
VHAEQAEGEANQRRCVGRQRIEAISGDAFGVCTGVMPEGLCLLDGAPRRLGATLQPDAFEFAGHAGTRHRGARMSRGSHGLQRQRRGVCVRSRRTALSSVQARSSNIGSAPFAARYKT